MLPLYGEAPYGEAPSQDFMDDVPRIGRMRGPRKIAPNDLPDRVTFADVNDPKSVIEVDRNDLRASLGPNITWKRHDNGQRDEIKGALELPIGAVEQNGSNDPRKISSAEPSRSDDDRDAAD